MSALVRCPQCGRETPSTAAPGAVPRCRYCAATLYGAKPVAAASEGKGKSKVALISGLIAGGLLLFGGCLAAIGLGVAFFLCSGVATTDAIVAGIPGGSELAAGPSNVTVDAPVPELPPLKQSQGDMPGTAEFDPATAVIPFVEPVEDPVYLPQPEWKVPIDPYVGEAPAFFDQPIETKTYPLLASLHGPFVVGDLPERASYSPASGLQPEDAAGPPSRLIDLRTGQTAGTFPPQAPTWRNGRLSPDGKYLVGPDTAIGPGPTRNEGKLFIWQPDQKEPSRTIELTGMLLWMDFVAPDRFATASVDEELALVPRVDKPDQKTVVALSRTARFRVWDVTTGKTTLDATLPEDDLAFRRTEYWDAFEDHQGLHPDGKTQLQGENVRETEGVAALLKGEPAPKLVFQPRRGYGAVSPGRKQVVLLSRNHLTFVSVADGKVLGRIPLDPQRRRYDGRGLSFSPDGKLLYGAIDSGGRGMQSSESSDTYVRLITWSLADGRRLSDPQIGRRELGGRAIPSPYPGSVLLTQVDPTVDPNIPHDAIEAYHDGRVYNTDYGPSAGGLVNLSGGGVGDSLNYVTLGWLPPNKALAFDPWKVRIVELTREAIQAAAGRPSGEHGPVQSGWLVDRPPAVEADRAGSAKIAVAEAPSAWTVPPAGEWKQLPLAATPIPTWPDAWADEQFAIIAYDKKTLELPADPQQAQYLTVKELPRPVWKRFDIATGLPIGEPIELWPWGVPNHYRREAKNSLAALTPAGDRLAYVDPFDNARVDVWDAEGKRIVGFHPFGQYDNLEWIGWAGDRLWALHRGKLAAFEMPSCKAVCEIDGGYRSSVHLPPGRGWLAAETRKRVDFIDASTGKILGRCEDPKHDDFRLTSLSPDGKMLLRIRLRPRPYGGTDGEAHLWNLATGKKEPTLIVGSPTLSGLRPYDEKSIVDYGIGGELEAILWNGPRSFLGMSRLCQLVDIDLAGSAIIYESPFYGETPNGMTSPERSATRRLSADPFGRFWVNRQIDPNGSDLLENREWRPMPLPNTTVPAEAEVFAADREVLFKRGSTVRVTVDLGKAERSEKLAQRVAGLLQQEGFVVGPNGWTLDVSYRVVESPEHRFDIGGTLIPAVERIWKLLAPDGAVVKEFTEMLGWSPGLSKYYTGSDKEFRGVPGEVVTDYYNFGLEDPGEAIVEEILDYEETVDVRALSYDLPRTVIKSGGKTLVLPIETKLTAP